MLDQARIQILKLVPPHIRVVVPAAWVWNVYSLIQTLLEYIAIVFWHGSGKNTFWLKHLELGMLISRLQNFSRVWLCFGMMMKTLFFLFFLWWFTHRVWGGDKKSTPPGRGDSIGPNVSNVSLILPPAVLRRGWAAATSVFHISLIFCQGPRQGGPGLLFPRHSLYNDLCRFPPGVRGWGNTGWTPDLSLWQTVV